MAQHETNELFPPGIPEEIRRIWSLSDDQYAMICQQNPTDDPQESEIIADPYGLPFEAIDTFSDAPLEFEELTESLWQVVNETYLIAVKYNRQSPFYLELCRHLEKDIRQLGSLCVTKAILEQEGTDIPLPDGLSIKELYAMVSLHFRKCRQAFLDTRDTGRGYDIAMMDWVCRWANLAERLKATEDKIRKIRSGKINTETLLDRARTFKGEARGARPQQDPKAIRRASSLKLMSSYASEIVRKQRESERQAARAARAKEKALQGTGTSGEFRPPAPFRPDFSDDADHIRPELPSGFMAAAPPLRTGPSSAVRKKLREKRKKRKQ